MTFILGLALGLAAGGWTAPADSCSDVVAQLQLPARVKTKGKPKRVRWDQANQLLHKLNQAVAGRSCHLTFEEVFAPQREDVFFPLLDSVLRIGPEDELVGVPVYYLDGDEAGRFSNRVIFEKSNYNQYYFQYTGKDGDLRTSTRNLLDFATGLPTFLIRWQDIKGKAVIAATGQE